LRAIYCWVYSYTNYQAINLCEISEKNYFKIKDRLGDKIGELSIIDNKIGGENVRAQVDETAICNGEIIVNSTSTMDDKYGIQWIVGAVVEGNCREFVLDMMVPNRMIFTLEDFFRRRINEKSIIVSGGHPSYPSAVRNFGSIHEVGNHSIGFKNESGVHTNQVERSTWNLENNIRFNIL
jgi:hypothetical protein